MGQTRSDLSSDVLSLLESRAEDAPLVNYYPPLSYVGIPHPMRKHLRELHLPLSDDIMHTPAGKESLADHVSLPDGFDDVVMLE